MPLFSNDLGSGGGLVVTVPQFDILTSLYTLPVDPESMPEYDNFTLDSRLKVFGDIERNSSLVGPSRASVSLAAAPSAFDPQIDVEDMGLVLKNGDRVAIGVNEGASTRVLWVGYVVKENISVNDRSESASWGLVGPELLWGPNGSKSGSIRAIRGQARRMSAGDDSWGGDEMIVSPLADWDFFHDMPAVFNPGGRPNMTRDPVEINAAALTGHIFEHPDRVIGVLPVARHWTVLEAVKYLLESYNDPEITGIANPNWVDVEAVVGADKTISDVDVEGLSLYEALRKVLSPEFEFFIDQSNVTLSGADWEGLVVRIFSRTDDIDGTEADLYLNPRNTAPIDSFTSVNRIQLVRDISKTINRVRIIGKYVRHLRLVYWGSKTSTLTATQKKTALQAGWTENIRTFASSAGGKFTVNKVSTSTAANKPNWTGKYVASAKDFLAHRHVFRLFTWNEDGTKNSGSPYYGAAQVAYWKPDLAGIADTPDSVGYWCRRGRPFQDTKYLSSDRLSEFRRIPPTLFIAAAKDDGTEPAAGDWRIVPQGMFEFDTEHGALWITADDLAEWMPFKTDENTERKDAVDPRTFGTLLAEGTLRLMVECSIDCDDPKEGYAGKNFFSGSPLPREVSVRYDKNFIVGLDYADGITSPISNTIKLPNDSAEIQALALQLRESAQDMQVHASISVEGDWPYQAIGKMIFNIDGRNISMLSGADALSGRAAQIVSVVMDTEGFNWQLLTESAALKSSRRSRRRARQFRKERAQTRERNEQ